MDFRSFRNVSKSKDGKEEVSQEELKKTAEKYGGKSDGELLGEIMKEARKGRSDGTFSDEKLDDFAKRVAPMLNAEQRERLGKAIKMIKGD